MFRKIIVRMLFPCLAFAFLIGLANAQSLPMVSPVDLNPKITSNQLVQKVDAFEVIIDNTESMNEIYKGGTKFNQQRALINLFNDTIPDLKLKEVVRMFNDAGGPISSTLFGPADYEKSALRRAILPSPVGIGFSPLDAAIDGATSDLRSQSGKMAVIVFSDGEDMGKYAPVAAAERMKSAYGDRICIYTVHLGNNPDGRKLLQQVADASQCGSMITGDDVSKPQGMADFVEKVFLEGKRPEPVKPPPPPPPQAPAPAPEKEIEMKKAPEAASGIEQKIVEKGRATLNVQFDTGKAIVKKKYYKDIESVAQVMKKYPDMKIVVEGHTDNVGGKQYNQKLSQKRSEAIKKVMVTKYNIESSRIKPEGFGYSRPVASNSTKEGKQQNRRVEAAVDYVIQK